MRRDQVTLVMLATGQGGGFTPVQIQKAMFLLTREAAELFDEGSVYHFEPYDYGPFDSSVYFDADGLARDGLATVAYGPGPRRYYATEAGIARGEGILLALPENLRKYISDVSTFVRTKSFSDLVAAIYRAYPEMRANSVFVDGK